MRTDSEGGRQQSCPAPDCIFSRSFQLELKTQQTSFPALRLRCKRFRFPVPFLRVIRHNITLYAFRLAQQYYCSCPFFKFVPWVDVASVKKTFCTISLIQEEICRYCCIRSTAYMKDQSLFVIHVFKRRFFIAALLLPLLPRLQFQHLRYPPPAVQVPAMEVSSLQR